MTIGADFSSRPAGGLEGIGNFHVAYSVEQPQPKKQEENIHTAQERHVDLSKVSCFC